MFAAQPSSLLYPFCWWGSGMASYNLRTNSRCIIPVIMEVMVIGLRFSGVLGLVVLGSRVILPLTHLERRVPSQKMPFTTHPTLANLRFFRWLKWPRGSTLWMGPGTWFSS